jgi:hypothetical protein
MCWSVMLLPFRETCNPGKPPEKIPLNCGLGEGSRVQIPAGPPSFPHCFGGFLGVPGFWRAIWVYLCFTWLGSRLFVGVRVLGRLSVLWLSLYYMRVEILLKLQDFAGLDNQCPEGFEPSLALVVCTSKTSLQLGLQ